MSAAISSTPPLLLDCGALVYLRAGIPACMQYPEARANDVEWLSRARYQVFLETGYVLGFGTAVVSEGVVTVELVFRGGDLA
jgi:hypothetical protein